VVGKHAKAAAAATPPAAPAPPAAPPASEPPTDEKADEKADDSDAKPPAGQSPFVDPQLQRAVEYLTQELARAQ
jgi:hypothetical protein